MVRDVSPVVRPIPSAYLPIHLRGRACVACQGSTRLDPNTAPIAYWFVSTMEIVLLFRDDSPFVPGGRVTLTPRDYPRAGNKSGTEGALLAIMRSLAVLLLTACATVSPAPKGGPRGLRASQHLEAAHRHEELATQAHVQPPPASYEVGSSPWIRSWDTAAEHERLAAIHRSKAGELYAAYEEACGDRPIAEVAVSPLQRHAIGGWDTAAGVILYLSPSAGGPDELLAAMKCHRAWMMLEPTDMDDCPLDLPGIQLDARGDHNVITVSIVVRDPKLVDELHRRAGHELETAMRREGIH